MQRGFLQKIVRAVLWRTGLGRWIGSRYWLIRSEGTGYEGLLDNRSEVFTNLPTDFTDAKFSEFIARDSARWNVQHEYVVAVSDVLLEPERLLGTRGGRELVGQTLMFEGQYPYIVPHLLRRGKATQVFDEAVWYDGSATRNYYHHFVHALSRLHVLAKVGLPGQLPLLITRQMFDQEFFQLLYRQSAELRQLNWCVVEPGQWIRVQRLYFAHALDFEPATWQAMRQLYKLPPSQPRRRIFLNRDRRRYGRYLANEDEVVAMLARYGFENTFAEHLTIAEQAALFADTEYLVALHGAGLVQMFFMDPARSKVIELMPANYTMPLYYWQAYALRISYFDVVIGGDMRNGQEYPVSLAMLEAAVQQMLANEHQGPVYGRTALPATMGASA